MEKEMVACETPTPGKKPTNIPRWKYEAVQRAILKAVPSKGKGILFKELPDIVGTYLQQDEKEKLGSITWHTTCVKLDMEVKGEISRVSGVSPQRLLRP